MTTLRFLQDYRGVLTGEQFFQAGQVLADGEEVDVEELLARDIIAPVVPGEIAEGFESLEVPEELDEDVDELEAEDEPEDEEPSEEAEAEEEVEESAEPDAEVDEKKVEVEDDFFDFLGLEDGDFEESEEE